MNRISNCLAFGLLAALLTLVSLSAVAAPPESVSFKDPVGDDDGPGGYTYPTDEAYAPGSFDLTDFSVTTKGDRVTFNVSLKSPLKDTWGLGSGFSTQMVFIFIQTENRQGNGFVDAVPGLNVKFAEADAWDKLVILSPQPAVRVEREVEARVSREQQAAIIVPDRAKGAGHTISASVDLDQLGGGDPSKWGYQVVIQSNEGFPENLDLLTRKVNEVAVQHRFGGGTDDDCDPNVIDVLAGKGAGGDEEIKAQHEMLSYACNPDGSSKKMAVLKMVRK
jgi:carbohydrate-binding DOMON domain-containing protein